jgi:hypothetical protein
MNISRKLCLLFVFSISAAAHGQWTQWRGPARDGIAAGAKWPETLGADSLKKSWRVNLGPGYSGPLVSSNAVFVTETKNRKWEIVTALDRATGRTLWTNQWEGAMTVPFFAKANGDWIRATPALDGGRLYVAGMCDVLVCLDAASGKEIWRVDFVKEYKAPMPDFGFVSSPLVDETAVYVQAGGAVAKLDKLTGKTLWRAMSDGGGMMGSAFSSPTFGNIAGKNQLLVQSRETLAGLDPVDGKVLWKQDVKAFRGMNILTPLPYGDGVFTSTYGGKTILYSISKSGDAFAVREKWVEKAQGYMSTPVVIGGHAYQHTKSQRFRCLDLATGEETWMSDRSFGKYWSLVAQGDRMLGLDEKGILYLLRANPQKLELLGEAKVADAESWAHLAVADRDLFVRDLEGISAFAWK